MAGVYWVPFLAGLGTACLYAYALAGRPWGRSEVGVIILLVLGIVTGLLAVVLAVSAAANAQAVAQLRRRTQAAEEQLATEHKQTRQLNSQLEVLTAMREVTRILSDAVDLEHISRNVFQVLEPLLGAEEIALILRDEHGGLSLKALRRGGTTYYADQIHGDEVDMDDAHEAIEHQQLLKSIDGSTAVFCVPLVADQAAVGVMRFEIPIEGSHEEKEFKIDEFEFILADIAKHLALVVKTPSLHDRAIIDSLTGLFTRRHFDIRIDDMFRLARRYGTPFSIILLDVDHFKPINDTHGHRMGDEVLRQTAAVITRAIRDCDSAFRYGGEEFAVLLPETSAANAHTIAERLRKAVRANTVKLDDAEVNVTVSVGVAEYALDLANQGELVARADRGLYAAKRAGRNRTVVDEGAPSAETQAPAQS